MTQAEHKLMVFMFTKQFTVVKALVEALKSKGVLEPDDLEAYEELVRAHDSLTEPAFRAIANQYSGFATSLGLQDQLPGKA